MPDTLAHSPGHAGSAALADVLASRLDLRPAPFPTAQPPDAALAVAPTSERRHRSPALPVVVLTRSAAARPELRGHSIVCGVHDEADAPAAAIASAMAEALELPLLLIHVLPPFTQIVPGSMLAPDVQPVIAEDLAWATAMLGRLVRAAGLDGSGATERRVHCGPPGPALAALARSEDAALVVVSASGRRWLLRALRPSVTEHLVRRSDRPVLVCPRHPAPAMRVREALSSAPQRAWDGP